MTYDYAALAARLESAATMEFLEPDRTGREFDGDLLRAAAAAIRELAKL